MFWLSPLHTVFQKTPSCLSVYWHITYPLSQRVCFWLLREWCPWNATAGIQEQHRLYHPTQAPCRTYSCAQEPWGAVHWKRPAVSLFHASERKVAPLYKRAFLHAHEAVLINEDIICLLRHLELILTGSLPCPLVLSPPLQRETISLKAKLMQICWLAQHFGKSN